MKKTLYIIILLASLVGNAQTYTTSDKALTGVFEVAGKSKAEIFSAINKWIISNYNSPKTVIQLSDGEAGNIIVKGTNEIAYQNTTPKILFPKMKLPNQNLVMKFNHLVEVNIKDNKYRVTYTILGIDYEPSVAAYTTPELIKMGFDCINIVASPDAAITAVSDNMFTLLNDESYTKEIRDNYNAATKAIYTDINSKLLTEMKVTMLSINKASITATNDGW